MTYTLKGWIRNLTEYVGLPSNLASADEKLRLIENFAEWYAENIWFWDNCGNGVVGNCEDCKDRDSGDREPHINEGYL